MTTKSKNVTFSLNKENIEKLDQLSKSTQIKKSSIINMLISTADNETLAKILTNGMIK